MKYIFSTIIGSFVLDQNVDITDSLPSEADLLHKYPGTKPLPTEKIPIVLAHFKDKKYFKEFYSKNRALTITAIRNSVSADVFIMQAIANLAELDVSANLLSKRLREWYGWYAPEVAEQITDHQHFAELIGKKNKKELFQELKINAEESMGAALDKNHVDEILLVAKQITLLYQLRQQHEEYLRQVMKHYCPNLLELAGVTLGAKLIEMARGLKHLALLPASTIQLLGAEKALFRHIKTGSRSPKHGIIINHPLVQNVSKEDKGKAARILADKLSLCARLDYFKGEFKAPEYRQELEKKLRK